MAATQSRNAERTEELRRALQAEREQLAKAIDSLRGSTDLLAPVRARLPLLLVAALGAGFVLGGGIGATARLLFRRGREGRTKARLGTLALVDRS
jgi:hypothetical protein